MRDKATTTMSLLVSRSVLEINIIQKGEGYNNLKFLDILGTPQGRKQTARTHFTKNRKTITFIVRIAWKTAIQDSTKPSTGNSSTSHRQATPTIYYYNITTTSHILLTDDNRIAGVD